MVVGATMLLPLLWAAYYGEPTGGRALGISMAISLLVGGGAWLLTRRHNQEVFRKEALAIVGLGWIIVGAFGALPYLFSGTFISPVDAYFEAVSGFTTTGSTVMTDIENFDRSILFWRSLTHWLGGMGIVVLFVAVLPYLGAGGKHLFKTEAPGPIPENLRPRIRHTAAILWKLYIALTVAETVLLMPGMLKAMPGITIMDSLYEALCHTFGTLATGGFSTKNASVAAFRSVPSIDIIIIFFMVLAGINFSLHFRVWGGDRKAYKRDPECRIYLGVLLTATLFVAGVLWLTGTYSGILEALRHGAFQVVSIATTTGYCTADFNQWPEVLRWLLVLLMFVGASAGSTGGGFKVIRWVMLWKTARLQLERVYRPRSVRRVRLGSAVIDEGLLAANAAFIAIGLGVFVGASLFMTLLPGMDLVTSLTSVAATLNNIGPGLEGVGAVENYAFIPWPGKMVLSLLMVMGRLELYSILVLFIPSFWRAR